MITFSRTQTKRCIYAKRRMELAWVSRRPSLGFFLQIMSLPHTYVLPTTSIPSPPSPPPPPTHPHDEYSQCCNPDRRRERRGPTWAMWVGAWGSTLPPQHNNEAHQHNAQCVEGGVVSVGQHVRQEAFLIASTFTATQTFKCHPRPFLSQKLTILKGGGGGGHGCCGRWRRGLSLLTHAGTGVVMVMGLV
jgi:hypothetical protein